MEILARSGQRHLVELDDGRDAIYDVVRDRLTVLEPPLTRLQVLDGSWERFDDDASEPVLLDAVARQRV